MGLGWVGGMSDDDFDGLLDDDDDEFLRMVDTLEHSATPVAACAAQDTPRHNASSKCNGDASAAKIPFVMRTPDSRGGAAPGTAAGSAFATGLSSLVAVDGRSQQHMGRAELTNQPATKRCVHSQLQQMMLMNTREERPCFVRTFTTDFRADSFFALPCSPFVTNSSSAVTSQGPTNPASRVQQRCQRGDGSSSTELSHPSGAHHPSF